MIPWWVIEASKDGVVFDGNTFVQGTKEQAESLARHLQDTQPWGWYSDFAVKPLSQDQLVELIVQ